MSKRRLAILAVIVLVGGGALALPAKAAAQPANDDFASATEIASLPFTDDVDTTDATTEPGEPSFCLVLPSNTIWYRFTPARTEVVSASIAGPTFAELVVYRQSEAGLSAVECTLAGIFEPAFFVAEAGVTYYIQVAASGQGTPGAGNVHLELQAELQPGPLGATCFGTPDWRQGDIDITAPLAIWSSIDTAARGGTANWLFRVTITYVTEFDTIEVLDTGFRPIALDTVLLASFGDVALILPTDDQQGHGLLLGSLPYPNQNPNFMCTVELQGPADSTPPTVSCSVPDQKSWYGDNVSVPCTASDPESGLARLSDAAFSLITSVAAGAETDAAATASRQVCDNAGFCTAVGPYTFKVDRKALTIACNGATFLLNESPASVTGVATDGGSGPPSQAVSAPADTSSVGSKTATLTASDAVGNAASQGCPYTVGYAFSGFLTPVQNPNTVNTGKAGRTYPVRWQLRDANGTFVSSLSAVADLSVKTASCAEFTNDPTDALETSTTGATGLRYDSGSNQYVYNWSTPSTPGCYTLFVKLDSGEVFPAFFNLS